LFGHCVGGTNSGATCIGNIQCNSNNCNFDTPTVADAGHLLRTLPTRITATATNVICGNG